MKNKQEYRLGVGISAMLLIFVVISIVTLGVLSFLSARADKALTDKSIEMVSGYYTASASAQRQLLVLDQELTAVTTRQQLLQFAEDRELTAIDNMLQFTVDAGSERVLHVAVTLDETFQIETIVQYHLENIQEWMPALSEYPVF